LSSSFSTAAESHNDFARQSKARVSTGLEDAKNQITKDIGTHEVFLYMKGSPAQPRCGFSANVVKILNAYPGVKFGSRDVLEDEYVREAIKQFSDWPTLPQLFVKGEFVGGSDIVGNMYKSGELDKLLGASPKKQ
jgi:monothiol glutaredoxin